MLVLVSFGFVCLFYWLVLCIPSLLLILVCCELLLFRSADISGRSDITFYYKTLLMFA